jgi:hypothetical protein
MRRTMNKAYKRIPKSVDMMRGEAECFISEKLSDVLEDNHGLIIQAHSEVLIASHSLTGTT